MRTCLLVLLVLGPASLSASTAEAQIYEGQPCRCGVEKGFSQGLPKAVAATADYVGSMANNASSCLHAGRYALKVPAADAPVSTSQQELDAWEKQREHYANFTCRFGPHRAVDKDTKTAWCEGAAGYGRGEVLAIVAGQALPRRLSIFSGFGTSKNKFEKNSRPKKLLVHILKGKTQATQADLFVTGLQKLTTFETTLRSHFGYQTINVPTSKAAALHKLSGEYYVFYLEILSSYPGSKSKNTCISEVSFSLKGQKK